jgi:Ni,Fe-hydrogenase III large subunit
MENCKTSREQLFERYEAEQGKTTHGLMVAFNEKMGIWEISTQTIYNWKNGKTIDDRYLRHAMTVYPETDWRYQFAADLLVVEWPEEPAPVGEGEQ